MEDDYPGMGFCSLTTLAASGPNTCPSAPPSGEESQTTDGSGIFGAIGGFFRRIFGST
jgi:hypothetical protein